MYFYNYIKIREYIDSRNTLVHVIHKESHKGHI